VHYAIQVLYPERLGDALIEQGNARVLIEAVMRRRQYLDSIVKLSCRKSGICLSDCRHRSLNTPHQDFRSSLLFIDALQPQQYLRNRRASCCVTGNTTDLKAANTSSTALTTGHVSWARARGNSLVQRMKYL
jgi:hypothetical protein